MVANARGVGMYTEAGGTAGNVAGNVLDVEAGDGAGVGAGVAWSVRCCLGHIPKSKAAAFFALLNGIVVHRNEIGLARMYTGCSRLLSTLR